MTKTEFLEELKEAMHRDEDLNEDMLLDDIDEWDSLAFVSVVGGKIKCRKRKIKCRIFATNYLSFNLKLKL
ncbi:hypothetical protein JLA80_001718 [Campylobacter jejuni]|nr:hypothetical protein [Campylobacter jejuni]EHA5077351.1 hypothetical protein [Campylobacter jejuni]EHC3252780.1 hypothetical protein [Campylobacter jejuni]